MTQSRRMVLKAAALAGTALFMPSGVVYAFQDIPPNLGADDLPIRRPRFPVTRSLLRSHVGSDFFARTAGGRPVALRLVEVEDVPNASAAGQEGSEGTFAARFTDESSGVLLSQGTYTLRHDVLGRVSWFLVPVGQPALASQTYEAIFNAAPRNAPRPPTRIRHRR
jgi:uncharacterized protein DUF6916